LKAVALDALKIQLTLACQSQEWTEEYNQ